ncbi:HNH endonuclease [Nocardiopsis alba]|uniref:HNH endonuclease n=1 Tax=Nocardiopsis alba TaxID=53437 RepID=UPI00131D1D32|nr:HNH endonuclease [Nocardiopsis alba]
MSKDRIFAGVEKALFLLSRGHCYEENCRVPVLQVIKGEPFINVQIAHICAEEEGGPRYDPSMTREGRRSFENLILLCKPHHTMIDRMATAHEYPVSLLQKWKKEREGDCSSQLNGLDVLNEERLQELMADAVVEVREGIDEVADGLSSLSRETVDTIRSLALEAFDRPYRPTLDYDAVESLERSARRLSNLTDDAHALNKAACRLEDLEVFSNKLHSTFDGVDWAVLDRVPGEAQAISTAIDRLPRSSSALNEITDRIEQAAAELRDSAPQNVFIEDPQRWNYFRWGLVGGLVIATGAIVFLVHRFGAGLLGV